MGRLTKRIEKTFPRGTVKAIELNSESGKMDIHVNEDFYDIADKLAHYEDLEEQGRLIVTDALTDALGDRTLYFIGTNNRIYGFTAGAIAYILNQNTKYKLREEVYFTQAGAERKLKELEGAKE